MNVMIVICWAIATGLFLARAKHYHQVVQREREVYARTEAEPGEICFRLREVLPERNRDANIIGAMFCALLTITQIFIH
jgi:hypothetical protein